MPDVAGEFWIDRRLLVRCSGITVIEQVEESVADQHVLTERHGPMFVDDHRGVPTDGLDPRTELFGVADRRRQAHHANRGSEVQDDLLPHRAAKAVGQEVDLIHHHMRKTVERGRIGVDHVPQHLGGHDHHGCRGIDRRIAGEQTDGLRTVCPDQIRVLLVAQRLDGGGVKALRAGGQGEMHGELADDRLARAGGRTHQDAVSVGERRAGITLERIEGKWLTPRKCVQLELRLRECHRSDRLRSSKGPSTPARGARPGRKRVLIPSGRRSVRPRHH